jgi:hypothetical protein
MALCATMHRFGGRYILLARDNQLTLATDKEEVGLDTMLVGLE